MRFWLTRNAGRPLREQLSAQLLLGILSGQLAPGQRIPSIRQLARTLKLHPNSVSLVYSDLTTRGWLATRPGSGVYVATQATTTLDAFIDSWLTAAQGLGFSRDQILHALQANSHPERPIVLDPDPEFARILATELNADWGGLDDPSIELARGRQVLCNPGRASEVTRSLNGQPVKQIALRSVDQMLHGLKRPAGPALIGIVSRSPSVREWAAMLLPAFGIPSEAALIRDPAQPNWQSGLSACAIVGADVVAANDLPPGLPLHIIRIVAL